jgi:hypothetical protein
MMERPEKNPTGFLFGINDLLHERAATLEAALLQSLIPM